MSEQTDHAVWKWPSAARDVWDTTAGFLDEVTDPVARAVLDLHTEWRYRCVEGCPDWPCDTVLTVAQALGLPIPVGWL